jgi:hypothetical protein
VGDDPVTTRALQVALRVRAAGLPESFVAPLVGHCQDHPADVDRAMALAAAVHGLGADVALLLAALRSGTPMDRFLYAAARCCRRDYTLGPSGERVLLAALRLPT